MNDFQDLINSIGSFFQTNGFSIFAAIFVLLIGFVLVKMLGKLMMRIIYATKIDNAAGSFFVSLFKVVLWIFLFFISASILGIDGNSFLVAFSSVALAIGLALKDSLANIANGIVILINKPFKKGDHVNIDGVEGVIKNIKILTTELTTFDNKRIVLPNSRVVGGALTNYSSNPTRRLDYTFSVSYDSDVSLVKKVLFDVVYSLEYTLKNPTPIIYMSEQNSSSLDFSVKFWVNTNDYWACYYVVNEKVFAAFKNSGIEVPYPQLDLHLKNEAKLGSDKHEKN